MLVESETGNELIDLRRQAHFWKVLHGRAVAREAAYRERAEMAERLVRDERARNEALTDATGEPSDGGASLRTSCGGATLSSVREAL